MSKFIDLTGQQFGRLEALETAGNNLPINKAILWLCKCSCGRIVKVTSSSLRSGGTKSCGCLNAEVLATRELKHGHASGGKRSSEYNSYIHAKGRCENPNDTHFSYYGGRGIEFRFSSFEEFLAHLGLKPSPDLTIDRIDNDGHYEKGNVRWASRFAQIHNRGRRQASEVRDAA